MKIVIELNDSCNDFDADIYVDELEKQFENCGDIISITLEKSSCVSCSKKCNSGNE